MFKEEVPDEEWLSMVDGASNKAGVEIEVVLITSNGSIIEMTIKLDFAV